MRGLAMASNLSKRSSFTFSGTCSSEYPKALVPGRGEYLNIKAIVNPTSRTMSKVCSKSASVSPGNPTIMSVDKAISGRACRRRWIFSKYCLAYKAGTCALESHCFRIETASANRDRVSRQSQTARSNQLPNRGDGK